MNISKVIASQVNLGYITQVGEDSYRVNEWAFRWEMARREDETGLGVVRYKEYRNRIENLGVKFVN